jgi:hypothetical protein
MPDKLVEFANAIDQDPELHSRYKDKPKETMKEFGVAAEDIELILSNDSKAIKSRLEMLGLKAFTIVSKSK